MKERTLNAATAVMVVCALVVTGLVIQREVQAGRNRAELQDGRVIGSWDALVARPQFSAARDAKVTIAVFADYTCRYCKQVEGALDSVQARFGDEIAVVYQYFPLYMGNTPFRAAVAAECAAKEGKFKPYHALLYSNQARLDSIPLDSLASVAGVADIPGFNECVRTEGTAPLVRENRARGDEIGVSSTPTMVINGRLFRGAVPQEVLVERVTNALREADGRAK